MAAPGGPYTREQTRPPTSAPHLGVSQGLIEDFSSLSLASVPGSLDPGLDAKALPRPLDGDVEPRGYTDMYPLNCNSRYLRLTTSAIPNSQSLVSRWHLPLGAVVCPLADAPIGVSINYSEKLQFIIRLCHISYVQSYIANLHLLSFRRKCQLLILPRLGSFAVEDVELILILM